VVTERVLPPRSKLYESILGEGFWRSSLVLADRRFTVLAFVLLVLFWSSAFGAIKVSLGYAPPVLFAGTRTLLCGAVMALAWLLWLGLVRAGEASRVAAYVFVVPLVSVLLGALYLNEALSPWLLIGAALVISGIYIVNRRSEEEKKVG
jgi:drug/metabolite transporter (DMT)-like permease